MTRKTSTKIIEQLLLIFYIQKEKPTFVSKDNSQSEKQVIFLMISNKEEWRYIAVKEICIIKRNNAKK